MPNIFKVAQLAQLASKPRVHELSRTFNLLQGLLELSNILSNLSKTYDIVTCFDFSVSGQSRSI
jgi:hypothetical protein